MNRLRWTSGLLMTVLLAGPPGAIPSPSGQIPGVPANCCGLADCRRADVAILDRKGQKALVRVDGNIFQVRAEAAMRGLAGGWFCYRRWTAGCQDGRATPECARCVIEAGSLVKQEVPEVAVLPAGERHLLIEFTRPCGDCHG